MVTIPKLKLEAKIGPITIPDLCVSNGNNNLVFIPDKYLNLHDNSYFTSGFITDWSDNGYLYIWYYPNNGASNSAIGKQSINISSASLNNPNFLVETVTGTSPSQHNGFLFYLNYNEDAGVQNPNFGVISYQESLNPPSLANPSQHPLRDFLGGVDDSVYSAFISQIDNRLYIICSQNNFGNCTEDNCQIFPESGFISTSVQTRPFISSLSLPSHDLYYCYDARIGITNPKSIISYSSGSGFQSNWWDAAHSAVTISVPVNKPLSKILSNSNLLSIDSKMMYGFDINGNSLYKFPTGALHYVFEKYDLTTGEGKMIFTIVSAQFDNYSSCDGKYTIFVYSYPTKDIAKLNY